MGKDGTLTFDTPINDNVKSSDSSDEGTVTCTYCGGSGWIGEGKCDICKGRGFMSAKYAK